MTPGIAVWHKDLPGVGINFSELQVALANILEAKEWSARATDALLQFPGFALASDRVPHGEQG